MGKSAMANPRGRRNVPLKVLFRAWAVAHDLFFHLGNLAYDAVRLALATVVKRLTKAIRISG